MSFSLGKKMSRVDSDIYFSVCSQIRTRRNEITTFVREAEKRSEEAVPTEEQSSGNKASLQSYEAAVESQRLIGPRSLPAGDRPRTRTVQGAGEKVTLGQGQGSP